MFAAATREVVFANPEVVRRINENFVPVALKAGLVNNPPPGIEGQLYAEIARSKPAPQGICSVNSAGKVLTWALSFDDDASIVKFLDHVLARYKTSPDASQQVVAERYMKFPSTKLPDVADTRVAIDTHHRHATDAACPATPTVPHGTLVGTIVGRALDANGKPITETVHQEHYMEARLQISPLEQSLLLQTVASADDQWFAIPEQVSRALVAPAYLGQLDVDPLANRPGGGNHFRWWQFHGQRVPTDDERMTRIRIKGSSNVKGGPTAFGNRTDGRVWEHHVVLNWHGFIDLAGDRIQKLSVLASGHERLRWDNPAFAFLTGNDVEHLMAGHKIDQDSGVRYGLMAESRN